MHYDLVLYAFVSGMLIGIIFFSLLMSISERVRNFVNSKPSFVYYISLALIWTCSGFWLLQNFLFAEVIFGVFEILVGILFFVVAWYIWKEG